MRRGEIGLEAMLPGAVLPDCTMPVSARPLLYLLIGIHNSYCPNGLLDARTFAMNVPTVLSQGTFAMTFTRKIVLLPYAVSELKAGCI